MFILWWRFYFGRIRARVGVDLFPSFPIDVLTFFHVNLLPFEGQQAKIIVVKHLIQGHNNVTRVRVEPRSCNQGCRKYNHYFFTVVLQEPSVDWDTQVKTITVYLILALESREAIEGGYLLN